MDFLNLPHFFSALKLVSRSPSHNSTSTSNCTHHPYAPYPANQLPIANPTAHVGGSLPADLVDILPFIIKCLIVLTIFLVAFGITMALIFNSKGHDPHPEPDLERNDSEDVNGCVYISLPTPVFKNGNKRLSRALFLNLLGAGAKRRRAKEEEQTLLLGGNEGQSLSPSPSPDYGTRNTGAHNEFPLGEGQEQEQEQRGRKKQRGRRGGVKHKRRNVESGERTTIVNTASYVAGNRKKCYGTRVEQLKCEAVEEGDDLERRV